MSNLNKDYLIKINVKEGTIEVPKTTFWNTDKNTSNMFIQLVINMSTNKLISQYVTIQNATNYKITLKVIKPKTNQYRPIEATLLDEEKALFEIDLPSKFTDQIGDYNFEFEVSSTVDGNDESITTSNGTYTVKGSILTGLNEEIESDPDLPILKQLIEQVQSLQGADLSEYQKKTDNTLNTTDKSIPGAINELKSAIENVTSGTNGREVELQKSTTHIQWRYVGDTDWTNLIALSDLRGSDGDTGLSAYELAQQEIGFAGTVEQWLNSLVGATPNLQIGTVETLASGSSATASITGTTENPLLNLGIPRGADGTSGTGGSSEKEWTLLKDVLIEEEVAAAYIDTDTNNNKFSNITELLINVKGVPYSGNTTGYNINFYINKTSDVIGYMNLPSNDTQHKYGVIYYKYIDANTAIDMFACDGWSNTNSISNNLQIKPNASYIATLMNNKETIESIRIATNIGVNMGIGTRFMIYGR